MSNEYKDYYEERKRVNDDIYGQLIEGNVCLSMEDLAYFLPELNTYGIHQLRIDQIDKEYFVIDVDDKTRWEWNNNEENSMRFV